MTPLIQHRNRIVRVDQTRLVDNAVAKTFLTADKAAASSALTVKDISGFAVGKYVWIDPFGANSEIIAVHASTTPTGSTITLAANTAFAHGSGEEVYYIEFNQVEISHADTLTGSKSVLATSALLARDREFRYLDTTETAGYYFAQFKDSVGSVYGGYSDGVEYGGWAANTVGYMIDGALSDLSTSFSSNLQLDDCIRWINKGLREIKGKVRRWPEHYVYDYVIGQTVRGVNTVSLPANIYDTETPRSIEDVRIVGSLGYLEPDVFDRQITDVRKTAVRTEAAAADTTLEIDNSYDYDDSGIVSVYLSGVKYTITYTGITRSDTTGVLTGIPASGDGSISVTIPVGTNVWQGETEGDPSYYTVRNSELEYWPLPGAQSDNKNITLDYNTAVTEVDSESDEIDYQRYDMLSSYLTWRIWCRVENAGVLGKENGYYGEYKEALNDAIRTMIPLQKSTGPRLNRMARRGGRPLRADPRLLPNELQ